MKPPRDMFEVTPATVVAAFTHAATFVAWWHHAGRLYYGKGCRIKDRAFGTRRRDPGLERLANDAARALGGWRAVRKMLTVEAGRPLPATTKPERGIRLRS